MSITPIIDFIIRFQWIARRRNAISLRYQIDTDVYDKQKGWTLEKVDVTSSAGGPNAPRWCNYYLFLPLGVPSVEPQKSINHFTLADRFTVANNKATFRKYPPSIDNLLPMKEFIISLMDQRDVLETILPFPIVLIDLVTDYWV